MKGINRKLLIVTAVITGTAVLALVILLVMYFLAFRTPEEESGAEKRKLTLYSSLKTGQLEKIESYYELIRPDVDLVFYSSGSSSLIQLVEEENRMENVECDVLWCAEPYGYLSLIEKDILSPLDLSSYPDLPHFVFDGEECMAAARLISIGLAVNTALYGEDAPRTFHSLVECDDVIIPDPYSSGSSLYTVTVLAEEYGWAYFSALKENGAEVVNGSSASLYRVCEGKGGVTIAPEYLVLSAENMGKSVRYISPEDISITIPSPIAVINGCGNPADAMDFVSFILSDSGQAFLYSIDIIPSRGEYSTSDVLLYSIPDEKDTVFCFDRIFVD